MIISIFDPDTNLIHEMKINFILNPNPKNKTNTEP